jgi:hypothetical protein
MKEAPHHPGAGLFCSGHHPTHFDNSAELIIMALGTRSDYSISRKGAIPMREGKAPPFRRHYASSSPTDNCRCHNRLPAGCGSRLLSTRPTSDADAGRFGAHPASSGGFGTPFDAGP